MRTFLLTLTCLALAAFADDKETRRQGDKGNDPAAGTVTPSSPAAEKPFEIRDGDRVLFLGDTLLEREGTYGYLETRMAEQFPDRRFTVRNLAFSADTPLGWSRASFDPPAKGFERLKEQLALVKPTVVFLGYGMAASLQEMTDRSQDWTLNRDPARYGAEPMSAARFKKELAQCMDAIVEVSGDKGTGGQGDKGKDAAPGRTPNGGQRAPGRVGVPPAGSGVSPEPSNVDKAPKSNASSANERNATSDGPRETRGPAGGTPTLPEARAVRFVLLSPIRHEDLRATRPGLPDPAEHNKLLEQYSKAIEELAKERGAWFKNLALLVNAKPSELEGFNGPLTDNGIHLNDTGYHWIAEALISDICGLYSARPAPKEDVKWFEALRAAIIRKNALFFHRWRPANETYLFGFRKREQGQNAVEIPKFDPLIEAAEAEIERLKKAPKGASAAPTATGIAAVTSRDGGGPNGIGAVTSRDGGNPNGIGVVTSRDGSDPNGIGAVTSRDGSDPNGIGAVTSRDGSDPNGIGAVTSRDGGDPNGIGVVTGRDEGNPTGIRAVTGRDEGNPTGIRAVTGRDEGNPTGIRAVTGRGEVASDGEKAENRPKSPILTSAGQLYAANAAPATSNQPPATSNQPPAPAPDPARQTPAETPDLSKIAASPSTLPHPDFTLADGLEISLWAENPLLAKPTECNWDAQGRLWVASSAMYPMIAPGQEATDKIIIIEDPGHTGKATKATVFVDGLLIPTGVAPVLVQDGEPVGSAKNSAGDKPRAMLIPIAPRDASGKNPVRDERPKIVISGKVGKPGAQRFTASKPLKLSEAVTAAGRTPFSDLRKVRLTRGGQSVDYNVEKILKEGRKDLDVPLQDGDVIYVPPVSNVDLQNLQSPQPPVPPAPDSKVPVPPSRKPQDSKTPRPSSPSPQVSQPPRPPRWACYVGQSTELLYFEDTDGDGKADKKRIVFSGFGTEDTHHIVHTLRWGPDGRLYFSQSVYIHTHMETPWGVVRVNSGGVFAYDPRTERVEVVEKGLWNTWGHAWDQWGQSFYTDGAGSTGLSWGFPGATFAPNEGARRTMASISPGSYPKFAGLELIYSPHFPAEWQGTAVTCDFRAHKIVHFKINDLGAEGKSGYVTDQLPVLVQTSDATFRPIDVKLGPDGALYIADWSNPIINHGEVDFRDPRRDHEHGRIWRLSRKGGAAVKWEDFNNLEGSGLLEAILSPNHWERDQARRIALLGLITRKDNPTVPGTAPLDRWWNRISVRGWYNSRVTDKPDTNDPDKDTTTYSPDYPAVAMESRRIVLAAGILATTIGNGPQHLTTEESIAQNNEGQIYQSLAMIAHLAGRELKYHTDRGMILTEMKREFFLDSFRGLIAHPHPRVRLEAMRALAGIPNVEFASLILDAAIHAPKDDPFYEFAAWLSINDLAPQVAEWVEKNSADTAANAGAPDAGGRASGSAGAPPAVPGAPPGTPDVARPPKQDTPPANDRKQTPGASGGAPDAAGGAPALPEARDSRENAASSSAARDAKILLALESLPPDTTAPLIAKLLAKRPITRDGAGPWIEPIGKGGGPAELQGLFERVAKAELDQPALVRAMNALADAARLRNLRPAGDLTSVAAILGADKADTRAAAARLAGRWKISEAAPRLEALAKHADAGQRAAAFEGLRSLGGAPAVAALEKLVRSENPSVPPAALAALAQLKPAAAIAEIPAVLGAIQSEPELLATWRGIFQSKEAADMLAKNFPANLPKPALTAALRAARELGRKGDRLVAKLTPLAGESAASIIPADFTDLAARAKKDGDPVAGEAIYRRMASACTTCHAIGGAGGKLGPDMTSIGASAPPDYIIESILNPAAKVKEGYHAFSFAMKDGTEALGIPSRETPQEQFIRTLAGEQGLPKANIVTKKIAEGGASLMPAGLTAAWSDRERLNLYAFLMELGRPGPFDASKNNVARVWQLTEVERDAPRTLRAGGETRDGAARSTEPGATTTPAIFAYTLVDGRLTKDLLAEKIAMLAPKSTAVHLTARFQAASAGKAKLNLTGIRKAWLDGQPLAIASEPSPSVELTAGAHIFTVEVDAKSPPEVLRLESPAASFLGD